MSDATIHSISGYTTDNSLFIELEYGPDKVKKDEHTFFKINIFNSGSKERTSHVDCDLVVKTNGTEVFKASDEYGEPSIHTTDGIMLTQYKFNQIGKYTISVVVEGLNFLPVKPLAVNFTANVKATPNGISKILISS
jgi:hypothetical protein